MLMLDPKDLGWWYALLACISLWLTLTLDPLAYMLALLIALIQLLHYWKIHGRLLAFPTQVRLAYFAYVLMAMPENLHWLLYLPAVGTLARTLFGYCLLARTVSLLPLNQQAPLSWKTVYKTYISAPRRGNILQGLSGIKE